MADIAVEAILNETRTRYKVVRKWYHPGVLRRMDDGKTLVHSSTPADGDVVADCPDIAVLQLEAVGPDLPAEVELASPDVLQTLQGQQVGMMGFPGYQHDQKITKHDLFASATFVTGTINRLTGFAHNPDAVTDQRRLVQYSAQAYFGFSGSPVFLRNGQVVVVNNHIHQDKKESLTAANAYGTRIDALWELLQVADLAQFVNGVPTQVSRTSLYRTQVDTRVEYLRSAMRMCDEAKQLSRRGDFQSAIRRVGAAIEIVPDYWRPYWQRALISNHYVSMEHARLSTREKRDLRRGSLADHVRASTLYQQGHDKPNVRLHLDIAREQINMGRLTGDRSHYEAAINVLSDENVLNRAKKYTDYLLALRGSVKLDQNDLAGALQDLNAAIELAPDSADYYRTRAAIWHRLGRHTEADRDYQRSAALHQEWMQRHGHQVEP
ncbi:MAG: tetratricopeptide repeat-containing serine protease family protein, partial [Pirellulales bacterium]